GDSASLKPSTAPAPAELPLSKISPLLAPCTRSLSNGEDGEHPSELRTSETPAASSPKLVSVHTGEDNSQIEKKINMITKSNIKGENENENNRNQEEHVDDHKARDRVGKTVVAASTTTTFASPGGGSTTTFASPLQQQHDRESLSHDDVFHSPCCDDQVPVFASNDLLMTEQAPAAMNLNINPEQRMRKDATGPGRERPNLRVEVFIDNKEQEQENKDERRLQLQE
ncbi:unnamed protein product, partial [Amoebophrya sp. A120]